MALKTRLKTKPFTNQPVFTIFVIKDIYEGY